MNVRLCSLAIEAGSTWPAGQYALCDVEGHTRWLLAGDTRLVAETSPEAPSSLGECERGPLLILEGRLVVEHMDGRFFLRVFLDVVRAAFPGVRWQVGFPVEAKGLGPDGADGAVAYGWLDGRCVGAVCEVLP